MRPLGLLLACGQTQEAAGPPTSTTTVAGIQGDILSPSVSNETIQSFLEAQEQNMRFRPVFDPTDFGPGTTLLQENAGLAVARDLDSLPDSAWVAGVVAERIDLDHDIPSLWLVAGRNYIWFDRLGVQGATPRAIVLSLDGTARRLMKHFTYLPASTHIGGESPLSHSQTYYQGKSACIFRVGGQITTWGRCGGACCTGH
jgi:hypothetical protein